MELSSADPFDEISQNWVERTQVIANTTIFLIFMPLTYFLMRRIICRHLDFVSKLILASYCIDFTLRLAMDILCITLEKCLHYNSVGQIDRLTLVLSILVSTIDRLKWLILYLFILEMRSVHITLNSESLEEYKKKLKCHNILWFVIVGFFLAL